MASSELEVAIGGKRAYRKKRWACAPTFTRTEIGLLERGERTPRIDTAVKLAGALGVDPGDLLNGIVWQPGHFQRGRFESG